MYHFNLYHLYPRIDARIEDITPCLQLQNIFLCHRYGASDWLARHLVFLIHLSCVLTHNEIITLSSKLIAYPIIHIIYITDIIVNYLPQLWPLLFHQKLLMVCYPYNTCKIQCHIYENSLKELANWTIQLEKTHQVHTPVL